MCIEGESHFEYLQKLLRGLDLIRKTIEDSNVVLTTAISATCLEI